MAMQNDINFKKITTEDGLPGSNGFGVLSAKENIPQKAVRLPPQEDTHKIIDLFE